MEKQLMTTETWKALDGARAGRNENRETLEMIHVTAEYIAVTNGRMLITAPLDVMSKPEPGTYEIISAKKFDKMFTELVLEKHDDVQYPDISRIIPASAQTAPALDLTTRKNKEDRAIMLSRAVIELYRATGNAYSMHLLEPLVYLDRKWVIHHDTVNNGAGKALLLTSAYTATEYFQAVILPFTLDRK